MKMDAGTLARLDGAPVDDYRAPAVPVAPFGSAATAPASAWPRYVGVWAGVLALIFAALSTDVAHMVSRWWNSSTYGHCLLIPPIIGWLVWQRREGLAKLAPMPWLPGAALMFGAGIVWLVGELAGASILRHAGIVFLFMASVPTIFGLAVARALTFPIGFSLFMIPAGEQLEPFLQTITAEFATWLLRLLGVPTYMDGVFISIPNGDFEVAQACSGVRFLIAMVAFGALVANVCFLSLKRRFWFMFAAVTLPIIANGIRVWGTIHIAYVTTPEFARGVDHVVYGWVFFAVVMAALLAVGWRYFDRPVEDPFIYPEKLQRPGTAAGPSRALGVAAAVALVAGAVAPAYAALVSSRSAEVTTGSLALAAPPGWSAVDYAGEPWKPVYGGATAEAYASFVDAAGHPVELFVAVYDKQDDTREMVTFRNGIIDQLDEGGWAWAGNYPPLGVGTATQINKLGAARDVVQYYWVNGRVVGTPAAAKLEGLKARALGGDPQVATVVVSAERRDGQVSERGTIERFLAAAGTPDVIVKRAIVPAGG